MIKWAIVLYITGLLLFYTNGTFHIVDGLWDKVYFIWDKAAFGGFLLWGALYKGYKEYRPNLAPIFIFSIIRFVSLIIVYATGVYKNNGWHISILFLALTIVTGIICFRPNTKLVRFLNKYI